MGQVGSGAAGQRREKKSGDRRVQPRRPVASDIFSTSQLVRRVIAGRASRRRFLPGQLFADPAWDILLELYALACEQRRTSVSKLCIAAGVPGTTALRWIEKLAAEGLLLRKADPTDGRRIWIELSPRARQAMSQYFQRLDATLLV